MHCVLCEPETWPLNLNQILASEDAWKLKYVGKNNTLCLTNNIRKKGREKTSTTVLKASCQKHRNWQLYSNEENGLQQFQMESCQPIRRLKHKKMITKLYLIHISICKMIPFQYEFLPVGAQSSCTEKVLELSCFICLHLPICCVYRLWLQNTEDKLA
jgi:hypothetical protein